MLGRRPGGGEGGWAKVLVWTGSPNGGVNNPADVGAHMGSHAAPEACIRPASVHGQGWPSSHSSPPRARPFVDSVGGDDRDGILRRTTQFGPQPCASTAMSDPELATCSIHVSQRTRRRREEIALGSAELRHSLMGGPEQTTVHHQLRRLVFSTASSRKYIYRSHA